MGKFSRFRQEIPRRHDLEEHFFCPVPKLDCSLGFGEHGYPDDAVVVEDHCFLISARGGQFDVTHFSLEFLGPAINKAAKLIRRPVVKRIRHLLSSNPPLPILVVDLEFYVVEFSLPVAPNARQSPRVLEYGTIDRQAVRIRVSA